VSTQRFAVEFDRRTVGIAVRVPGGFMYYSSGDDFAELDGQMFRRARAIERQMKRIADRLSGPRQQFQPQRLVPALAFNGQGGMQ
jgi:hypothetical protein